jgi:hypothetical protein
VAGKSVVTANKALLSRHGVKLAGLAERNHIALNFEAAVGGAIPIVKTLREGMAGNSFERIYGILNGTCNYILTRMEQERMSFADCLKDAQRLVMPRPTLVSISRVMTPRRSSPFLQALRLGPKPTRARFTWKAFPR